MTQRASVYCAGPLFTPMERNEMLELATALEGSGYDTFLPQRDGLELSKCVEQLVKDGCSSSEASRLMAEAIFALDVYQVLEGCNAVVANLNGRVPDEGTVSEVAMAWARGKVVVGYKTDSRSVFEGHDNPLVTGLFNFELCKSLLEVVAAVGSGLAEANKINAAKKREVELTRYSWLGGRIWSSLQKDRSIKEIADIIIQHKDHPVSATATHRGCPDGSRKVSKVVV